MNLDLLHEGGRFASSGVPQGRTPFWGTAFTCRRDPNWRMTEGRVGFEYASHLFLSRFITCAQSPFSPGSHITLALTSNGSPLELNRSEAISKAQLA